jgi:hypothetical protein
MEVRTSGACNSCRCESHDFCRPIHIAFLFLPDSYDKRFVSSHAAQIFEIDFDLPAIRPFAFSRKAGARGQETSLPVFASLVPPFTPPLPALFLASVGRTMDGSATTGNTPSALLCTLADTLSSQRPHLNGLISMASSQWPHLNGMSIHNPGLGCGFPALGDSSSLSDFVHCRPATTLVDGPQVSPYKPLGHC